jgi:D-glycero-D-manno-heptose 1,7-bisphosphate phosphatase
MNKHPAIFIDKDGTLIENIPHNVDPDAVVLSKKAEEALKLWDAFGYKLIAVSNQSGVAHGYFKSSDVSKVEDRIVQLLKKIDVKLSGFYFCPHHPEGSVAEYSIICPCRKPDAGLFLKAADDLHINLEASWMIGDILDDVEAGRRAGCRTILINNGNETEWILSPLRSPHFIAQDLAEAARFIVSETTAASNPELQVGKEI